MASFADEDQIRSDEAYARLLARQEDGAVDGIFQDPFAQELPRNNSHSLRENVMVRVNVLQGVRHSQNMRLWSAFTMFWNVPKILAIAIILGMYWNPGACDSPLLWWAFVECIRLFITLSISMAVLCGEQSRNRSPMRQSLIFLYKRSRYVHFAWFLVGAYWVFSSTTCAADATAIYHLCIAILIIDCVDFFKNCIALVCLIPVALLCLPCVIRLISVLDDPTENRGASEEEIINLPSHQYEKGMFPEEEPQCIICRCEYEEGDEIRMLPCNKLHHFHAPCIDEWLRVRDNCPYCRTPVINPDRQEAQGGGAAAPHAHAAHAQDSGQFPNEMPDDMEAQEAAERDAAARAIAAAMGARTQAPGYAQATA